jgi:F5/8 type C domain-containing protein/alpha-L-rhamnosidase-like protein
MRHRLAFGIVLAWATLVPVPAAPGSNERVLDSFDDTAPWAAIGSTDVQASVHPAQGVQGSALRLDFDLAGTAGYAIARRELPVTLPENYEITFWMRGDAPVNTFQLKLVDASGENVWWLNRPNFEFPREWQLVRIKQRHIHFAWGPGSDRTLRQAASVEFVVAAGRGGGHGSVYLSRLVLRELPVESAPPPPAVHASSALPDAPASLAIDGSTETAWKSDGATGPEQTLTVDFQRPRELGGVVVRWLAAAYASRYDVELSDDGARWRTVRTVLDGRGGPDVVWLPETEARFVRLVMREGPARAYGLAELEIEDAWFGTSPNAVFETLAREAPRGTYPRGMSGEQTAWTVVGVEAGAESGLLSEDGALEVSKGGFSIEPFVVMDSRVVTWADVEARPFLVDGSLPMPGVTWRHPSWELRVTAFASGSRDASRLVGRYELKNLTRARTTVQLVLAVRPFQVNPPVQSLNIVGGASAIRDLAWDGAALSVNTDRAIYPLRAPDRVAAFRFDAGPVPRLLAAPDWSGPARLHDAVGWASAALAYQLTLEPGATATVGVVVPLTGPRERPAVTGEPTTWMEREQAAAAGAWRERLGRVSIDVPEAGQPLVSTLRTALAHVLVTRDGPVLRPGVRSYARSWIRDGTMMAESLLRLGHAGVAADYLRWYVQHLFSTGQVPCCVDGRGRDPVPEHDSPGELVFLAAEIYRYTGDRRLLEDVWPHVERTMAYLESLRHSERTAKNLTAANQAFYGLLPRSISHEGYAAKPMHSYWDDFWALKGYTGAVTIASALDRHDDARRFAAARDEFRQDVEASLRQTTAAHGITYLPGAAELGDFDPTSSTIAISPGGELHRLPPALVLATYERYWREFADRRDGRTTWQDYTPYEIRTVGTFVRLGWRERAHELLAFFLAGRRPVAWNQWPEVVYRDPKTPRFVGDMPHGWIASDFIRAVLDLFAYERERDDALVLAAGVPTAWLDGPGVAVRDLRTPYGRVSYSLKREASRVVLQVAGDAPPRGGFVLAWPGTQPPSGDTRVNGQRVRWDGTELRFHELPATVVVDGSR